MKTPNRIESGGPVAWLRLATGLCLALCLLWEIIGRPLLAAFFPDARLGESFLREIWPLLLSLLGM